MHTWPKVVGAIGFYFYRWVCKVITRVRSYTHTKLCLKSIFFHGTFDLNGIWIMPLGYFQIVDFCAELLGNLGRDGEKVAGWTADREIEVWFPVLYCRLSPGRSAMVLKYHCRPPPCRSPPPPYHFNRYRFYLYKFILISNFMGKNLHLHTWI